MKKLIKLSTDHYVVVDDSIDTKEGDLGYCVVDSNLGDTICKTIGCIYKIINVYMFDEDLGYYNQTFYIDNFGQARCLQHRSDLLKVTHSTKPLDERNGALDFIVQGITELSLQEVEELVNGYSVDSICEKEFNIKYPSDETIWKKSLWKDGFKAHQELTKDKLFTIEDIINAHYIGWIDRGESETTTYPKAKNNFKQSVLPKSEWLVEFDENSGKLKLV